MISTGETMERVKVGKMKLLECLRTNYARHQKELAAARVAYLKKAEAELEAALAKVKGGNLDWVRLSVEPPDDHTDAYVRAITMLEMSEDESFTITATQFAAFVQDQWGWKASFSAKNASYTG